MTTGAFVSATVNDEEQLAELPEVSVADQVSVAVPSGKLAWPGACTVAGEQTSMAVAAASALLVAPPPTHSAVTGAGQVMEGGSVSLTCTCVVQLALFPAASVAVYVTAVFPSG